jgi:hypothetical protein
VIITPARVDGLCLSALVWILPRSSSLATASLIGVCWRGRLAFAHGARTVQDEHPLLGKVGFGNGSSVFPYRRFRFSETEIP